MHLLLAFFSNTSLLLEKEFHSHLCANLVVSQEYLYCRVFVGLPQSYFHYV